MSENTKLIEVETINKILGPIYVSSYEGAAKFEGVRLGLHQNPDYAHDLHIPLLHKLPKDENRNLGGEVNLWNLELIFNIMEEHFNSNEPLLVHCRGGVERSPLACVLFLMRTKGRTLDEAYEYVKLKRPVAADRRSWIPEEFFKDLRN